MKVLKNSAIIAVILFAALTATQAQEEFLSPPIATASGGDTIGSLAESISTTTGVAISPLVVMGALGAYKYCTTDEGSRGGLEWFCHPAVWGLALGIGGLLLLKSTGKVIIPAPFVAPVDALDHFARHTAKPIAGICTAVPASMKAVAAFGALNQTQEGVMYASALPLDGIPGWGIATAITSFIFAVVWMSFNAVDTLVMLCPFGPVELISKLLKGFILVLIVAFAALSPVLALILCAVIILIATKVAGWAYRLTIFGFVLMYDLLMPGSARKRIDLSAPHAFVKCKAKKIPARTYGRITNEPEGLVFRYRPVFFAPTRKVVLPSTERYIVKGILMSGMNDSVKTKQFCKASFPPRYKKQEEAIAANLRITDIRDCSLIRGWKGFKLWFSDTFLGKPVELPPEATSTTT